MSWRKPGGHYVGRIVSARRLAVAAYEEEAERGVAWPDEEPEVDEDFTSWDDEE